MLRLRQLVLRHRAQLRENPRPVEPGPTPAERRRRHAQVWRGGRWQSAAMASIKAGEFYEPLERDGSLVDGMGRCFQAVADATARGRIAVVRGKAADWGDLEPVARAGEPETEHDGERPAGARARN